MWSRSFAPGPPAVSPIYSQLYELGNAFRSMYDTVQTQGASSVNRQQLDEMIKSFAFNPFIAGLPVSTPTQNNPWVNPFPTGSSAPTWNASMVQMPALGIGREYQEDWTLLLKYQQEYASALQGYVNIFQGFTRSAGEQFIQSISNTDEELGFEDMYRKWIDCCEVEFEKVAFTSEYAVCFGKLIDSYIRLLQHQNKIQEKTSRSQGQPTRSELDRLHQQNSQANSQIDRLNETIRDLQLRLAQVEKPKPQRKRKTTSSSAKARPPRSKK